MFTRIVAIVPVLIVVLALSPMGGCASASSSKSASRTAPRPAPISHFVFCKLKDPLQADELILDCDQRLGTLPIVTAYACGKHIDTGRGARIDSNYDVGLYVGFATEADYAAYADHPQHLAILAKWSPRWEWIRIEDVLDLTP